MSYYEFVEDDFKVVDGFKYHRIRATKDFKNTFREVKKGELGGYVRNPNALKDYSWVFGNAVVISSDLFENSFIIGDYTYRNLILTNSFIHGTGDYLNSCQFNRLTNFEVIGHNFIQGSRHSVIWGLDKDTKQIKISVGCQRHTLVDWKTLYKKISEENDYNSRVEEYLTYLNQIEEGL